MPLKLRPAVPTDMRTLAIITQSAFREASTFHFALWGPNGCHLPESYDALARDNTRKLTGESGPGYAIVVVVDSDADDEIIGSAHWRLEDEETYDQEMKAAEERKTKQDKDVNASEEKQKGVPGLNMEALAAFNAGVQPSRYKAMGRSRYWHLYSLTTNPKHARRGAGRMLVEWGLQRADEDGLDAFVTSSETGRPLYARCGFVEVASVVLDLDRWGIEGTNSNYAMIRRCSSKMPPEDVEDRVSVLAVA